MAAMDSSSSCGPQANAQPPPPMAQAPMPMGVMSRSLLPSRFFCISSTIANASVLFEEVEVAEKPLLTGAGGSGVGQQAMKRILRKALESMADEIGDPTVGVE